MHLLAKCSCTNTFSVSVRLSSLFSLTPNFLSSIHPFFPSSFVYVLKSFCLTILIVNFMSLPVSSSGFINTALSLFISLKIFSFKFIYFLLFIFYFSFLVSLIYFPYNSFYFYFSLLLPVQFFPSCLQGSLRKWCLQL